MSALDVGALVLILIHALVGWTWGLWSTVCRLAGLLLCVPVAWLIGPHLAPELTFVNAEWRLLTARRLTGFLVLLLGSLLGWAGTKMLKAVAMNWINRLLGALVGVAGGAALAVALVFGALALHERGVLREPPSGLCVEGLRDLGLIRGPAKNQ